MFRFIIQNNKNLGVYIKKMLIERMIDNLNEEKEASSHENTHSGKESKKTGSN